MYGALNQGFPFSPLMTHFRDLRDGVEYKFLDCTQHSHQLRKITMYICDGQGFPFSPVRLITMAGQDLDGGGRHRENVYVACRVYVVVLALGDLVATRHFP